MQAYQENISAKVNGVLTPILGVKVTVTDDATGHPATLFSDNGVTQITGDIVTDETGYFGFFAANGSYTVSFSSPQIRLAARNIDLYDPLDDAPLTQAQAAASSGASKIGIGAETVENALNALQLADYVALRAYTGPRQSVYVIAPGIAGMFVRDDSDTTSADNGGTVIVASNGKRWKRGGAGALLNILWFGAACDRVTDDTAAVQKAVTYCLSLPRPPVLAFPGMARITASVNIDRPVDSTASDFVLKGVGGGVYVDSAITMFDSTIAMPGTDPVSEFVTFDGMQLEASDPALAAFVISRKFMRLQFRGCNFQKIKCADMGPAYAQTWRFFGNRIRQWSGYFFKTSGSFDVHFSGNIAEFGGSFFRSFDAAATKGSAANRFIGNLFEGSTGAFIEQGYSLGLTVEGNYLEGNSGRALDLAMPAGGNQGVHFASNMIMSLASNIADPTFFEVRWGSANASTSTSNYCSGRLHDQSAVMNDALRIHGDKADTLLIKGNASGITDATRAGVSGKFTGWDRNSNLLYSATGMNWAALDSGLGGIAFSSGINSGSEHVARRLIFGTANPQSSPGNYGNINWVAGSRVINSAPAVGAPKGWVCTATGAPGTWVSEGNL